MEVVMPSYSYPVEGRHVATDLKQSMRAARLVALRATRKHPNRNVNLPAIQLANLTASLERIIALLEG
jgi:predicted nucleic acid-binding Zn ribbon protein